VALFDAMRARWSAAGPVHVRVGAVRVREAGRSGARAWRRSQVTKSDVGGNVFANSPLVDMYLSCRGLEDAHRAFAAGPERNVTMWTAVISEHGQHGRVEALALFDRMTEDGFRPDDVTFLAMRARRARRRGV
jgi:pentatricopeptide repeat protein